MSVSSSSLDQTQDIESGITIQDLVNRYAIHLGLLLVAVVVGFLSRTDLLGAGIKLDLPSTEAQVAAPTVVMEETAAEVVEPTLVPAVIPDLSVHRVAMPHTYEPELPTHHFAQHVVEKGDTPNKVAEAYGLEPQALLWGNPELSGEAQLLQVGITLTILPTNGVLHTIHVSDTLAGIAEFYGVDPQKIIDYEDNHLEKWPHRPIPETRLLIPGGEKPLDIWSYTPNTVRGQVSAAGAFYQGEVPVLGTYSFVWPTNSWRITQYYWWAHRGLDIGAPTGAPVYASDSGTVVFSGWNTWGYGNLIVVNHGNGFETYYAHLSSIWVGNGQYVYQGMQIGEVGNTGNSSGSHLHFEIRFGASLYDPLSYLWE